MREGTDESQNHFRRCTRIQTLDDDDVLSTVFDEEHFV